MQLVRPAIALDPRRFGRSVARTCNFPRPEFALADDAKLFLTTFAAGFIFVSVLIA